MTKVEDIQSVGGGLAQKVVQFERDGGVFGMLREPLQNWAAVIVQIVGVPSTVGKVGRILSGDVLQVGATTHTQVTGIMNSANDAINQDSEPAKKVA